MAPHVSTLDRAREATRRCSDRVSRAPRSRSRSSRCTPVGWTTLHRRAPRRPRTINCDFHSQDDQSRGLASIVRCHKIFSLPRDGGGGRYDGTIAQYQVTPPRYYHCHILLVGSESHAERATFHNPVQLFRTLNRGAAGLPQKGSWIAVQSINVGKPASPSRGQISPRRDGAAASCRTGAFRCGRTSDVLQREGNACRNACRMERQASPGAKEVISYGAPRLQSAAVLPVQTCVARRARPRLRSSAWASSWTARCAPSGGPAGAVRAVQSAYSSYGGMKKSLW